MQIATRLAALALAVVLGSCGGGSGDVPEATRSQVLRLADEVEAASMRRDAKAVMALLPHDVSISMRPGSDQARNHTYESYSAFLSKMLPLISDYSMQRSGESFALGPDGEIQFSFRLRETYSMQGKDFDESHGETWHLRNQAGALEIYKIVIDE